MAARSLIALASALALLAATPAGAAKRSRHQPNLFMQQHACPSNGHKKGSCPGYVVDHIKPPSAGGPDRPSNMQWQTIEELRSKTAKSG